MFFDYFEQNSCFIVKKVLKCYYIFVVVRNFAGYDNSEHLYTNRHGAVME